MAGDRPAELNDNLRAGYQQVCDSYRAIDDFRLRLLGLLPLATGAGVFFLAGDADSADRLSLPAGLFGFVVTLGLFSYELHGIKKCGHLIDAGKLMEEALGINGQFKRRPHEVAGIIDEPFAASVIYPASLAGWMFLALLELRPLAIPVLVALLILAGGFTVSWYMIRAMEDDLTNRKQYAKEPCFRGSRCEEARAEDIPRTAVATSGIR